MGANTPYLELRPKVLKRVGGRQANGDEAGGCCEAGCEFQCQLLVRDFSLGCSHGQQFTINVYKFAYCFFVLTMRCEKLFYRLGLVGLLGFA